MNFAAYLDPATSAWVAKSLAHVLWQGTLVSALAAVAALAFRSRTAQARYSIHCAAMLLTAACLLLNLWLLAPTDRIERSDVTRGASTDPMEQRPAPAIFDEARVAGNQTLVPIEVTRFGNEAAKAAAEPLADTAGSRLTWVMTSQWIVGAYVVGIGVMAMRLLMGLYGCQRLRTTAQPIEEARLHQVLLGLGERLRLKVIPVVAYSARVTTPLVVGVVKPAILLPAAILNDLTTEQVESLLLHELAHIHRYDHWANLLQRIIEVVLFFHPAVWWLSRKISLEREHCCDDLAIRWGSEPCDYAESLVRLSEVRYRTLGLSGSSAATLAATGNRPSQLRERVLRVLGTPLPRQSVGLTRVGVGSLLVVALASAALLAAIPEESKTETDSQLPKLLAEDGPEFTGQVESEKRGTVKIAGKIIVADDNGQEPVGWIYSESEFGNNSSYSTEGRFDRAFECEVPAGAINLRFFPDGDYAPAVAGPFELKAGETLNDVRVDLTPGHTQTISVVTDGYQPIEGATVLAHPLLNGSTNGPNVPLTTDAKGVARLRHVAPDTRYTFKVEAPGFQKLRTEPRRLPRGGEEPLSLWMVRAEPATGVVRFPDGSPAPSTKIKQLAEVFPTGGADNAVVPKLIATTNGEGRFGIDSLSNDSAYVLVVEALDFSRAIIADVTAGTQDAQIVLPERHDLVVRVKGDLQKLPKRKGKPYVRVFQRFNLSWDDRGVGALLADYATIEPTQEGGQAIHRGLAIDLRPDSGPQQVEVMLGQDESTKQAVQIERNSDRATFVVFDLRPADEKEDGAKSETDGRSSAATILARPQVADIDYSRREPKTVRVLNPDGEPPQDAAFCVIWWRDGQGDYDFGTSEPEQQVNERGEVVLSVPAGAERMAYRVEAPGFAAVGDELSLSGDPVVRLQQGRVVRVLALDLDGKPLEGAVPLIEDCRYYPQEFKSVPEQPGLYESPVVSLDRRWMRVVGADGRGELLFSNLIDLDEPANRDEEGVIVTRLHPGARVTGKLDDSVPRPVKIGCVDLYVQQGADEKIIDRSGWSWRDSAPIREDGTFEFPSVPPGGHVQLFALAEGYHSSRPSAGELRQYLAEHDAGEASLILPALSRDYLPRLFKLPKRGDSIAVELPCVPAASADIQVVDPTGRPIEDATVRFNPNIFFLGPEGDLPAHETRPDSARVRQDSSQQAQEVREALYNWAISTFYRVSTDADGVARVRSLPADQRLTCRVEADGYVMPLSPDSTRDFEARYALIESKGGQTLRRTITMERLIAQSTRDLAVVDSSGKPVAGIKISGAELAFEGAEEDWQLWAVQRFGAIPTAETDAGGQLRFDIPREVDGKRVAAMRVVVQGRFGGNGYVQRRRVVVPPDDDGGVIVLTESDEEPLREGDYREVNVAYLPLSELQGESQLDLLKQLEQRPSITVLRRLLTAAELDIGTPLSFRAERNLLNGFEAEPNPVARVTLADGSERVVVMCYVRPRGVEWDIKPRLRFPPEAAFVFDGTSGRLITMIGGWASSKGDYCSATLTDLGTPGDYFVQTSAFEERSPFDYRTQWTRLGNEEKPLLTVLGYANATSWSAGSQMGPLTAEYGYTGFSFNSRSINDSLPGVLANGSLAPRKVYWDRHAQTFVGPSEMSFEGTPLFRILPDQSASFKAVTLEPTELFVAGGRGRYRDWHIWDVVVPAKGPATLKLSLESDPGDSTAAGQSREWTLAPGMHTVQLQVKKGVESGQPDIELRVDGKTYKESIGVPRIEFTSHPSRLGEPVVSQGTRSVVVIDYPTSEDGVQLVGTLRRE